MALLCSLAAICVAAPGASAAGFLAGAGTHVTTPPLRAAHPAEAAAADAKFAPAFATACAGFPDRGRFALQEPFVDVNKNGQWDSNASLDGPPTGPPEPYCDANGNGRWDGIYADNNKGPATGVHDDVDARAVAISDERHRPLVYVSVDQIGLFDFYTDEIRQRLKSTYGVDADVVVSANHNESSPDSIGLFGPFTTPVGVGARSGIDEYYMDYLADAAAHAAADAVHSMRPARLYANQVESRIPDGTSGNRYPILTGLSQRISDQFPTSVANPDFAPNDDRVAAVDPKLGVLQAREAGGKPIFTVMSFAAHNQEMGNAGAEISADWPGAFERAFDAAHPGTAVYLVGDNGSEEDPQTEPPKVDEGSENHKDVATQWKQASATGEQFAAVVADAAMHAARLRSGTVALERKQVCVPLENNGFIALAAAGEFGRRQGYACDPNGNPVAPVPNGAITPTSSTQFRTYVGFADIGPDLQLIDNPAEAFPALMLGSPFGKEDESCDRPNPAVPTWHARAAYRFQVGLADDLIGYLIPAWGFASETPGLFNTDNCYHDAHGRHHKLESESVGPTGGNIVANTTTKLLDAQKDASARIVVGARFVDASGHYSRWATGAAGILVPASGAGALDPEHGTLVGAPRTAGFGARAVDRNGVFMDYDGQPQAQPGLTTRGMMTFDKRGCVAARYYLNVFPPIDESHALGAARTGPAVKAGGPCAKPPPHVPPVQPGTGPPAGIPLHGCRDRTLPRSVVRGRALFRHGRLTLHGRASDRRCHGRRGRVVRVAVVVHGRIRHGRCRFLLPRGRLGHTRRCRHATLLLARGTSRWRLRTRARLPRGRYVLVAHAVDQAGNVERTRKRRPNVAYLKRR